jgi:hypothetical protein
VLQPASKVMIVAVMLAMSAWVVMMRAFWGNSGLLIRFCFCQRPPNRFYSFQNRWYVGKIWNFRFENI